MNHTDFTKKVLNLFKMKCNIFYKRYYFKNVFVYLNITNLVVKQVTMRPIL